MRRKLDPKEYALKCYQFPLCQSIRRGRTGVLYSTVLQYTNVFRSVVDHVFLHDSYHLQLESHMSHESVESLHDFYILEGTSKHMLRLLLYIL